MSFYYYNNTANAGFIMMAKNASTSIEPYLNGTGFKQTTLDDLQNIMKDSKWFYILRNPIDRFCSGIVETYLAVNENQYGAFGASPTQKALMALSDFAAQEFCFNLLARIPAYNSKDRKPEGNIPVNEGLGYTEDVHTMLQSTYLNEANLFNLDIIPVSMYRSNDLPLILKSELNIAENYSNRLLKDTVKNYNVSDGDKKRMNKNLKEILVANKEIAVFRHIWDYLAPDIQLWNGNIDRRYMASHHANEIL